jgi:arylsulfatase A-like enzyme
MPNTSPALTRRQFLRQSGASLATLLLSGADRLGAQPARAPAQGSPSATQPNIVLLIVDSVRADHVSAYGYARSTTPNLDTLMADQGVRFEQATATAPWTFPSNASMMTGRHHARMGINWQTSGIPAEAPTLAQRLRNAGYYTAGFVSPYYVSSWLGFNRGFDTFDDTLNTRPLSNKGRAGEVNALATSWLQQTWLPSGQAKPLFLFLYYLDPHVWYTPPAPYDARYDPTYTGTLTGTAYGTSEPVVSGEIVPTTRDVEHLIALYDGEIAYCDVQLKQILDTLETMQLLDNALVAVAADHGEMFGEHGKWTHSNSVYEELLRVPLLLRYPGVIPAGQTVDAPIYSMDLMPTILDFAGIPIPTGLDSISLRPLIEGNASADPRTIFGAVDGLTDPTHGLYWLAPHDTLYSVRKDSWKSIHHLGDQSADELYQLQPASLYETTNLRSANLARAQGMRDELWQWLFRSKVYLPLVEI